MAVCTWVQWCHSAMFETYLYGELTEIISIKGRSGIGLTDGMPNIENMQSRRGMTLLAEMEVKASTTGNLL